MCVFNKPHLPLCVATVPHVSEPVDALGRHGPRQNSPLSPAKARTWDGLGAGSSLVPDCFTGRKGWGGRGRWRSSPLLCQLRCRARVEKGRTPASSSSSLWLCVQGAHPLALDVPSVSPGDTVGMAGGLVPAPHPSMQCPIPDPGAGGQDTMADLSSVLGDRHKGFLRYSG